MKTIIYIKVIIYGFQAPFRVNITECFETFMNQAWHHRRAEKYYLYIADKRSKVKLSKPPHTARRQEQEPGSWCCTTAQYLLVQYLYSRQAVQRQPGKLLVSEY